MSKVDLKINWASYAAAKYACLNWHYSGCIPMGKLVKIGVWEQGKYIGVVIFSRGTAKYLGKKYNLTQTECVELTRVALTDHKTPVSRILVIALKILKKSNNGIKLVVSFAAKSEGHHGGIYQATNWIYAGETAANAEVTFKGKRLTNRAFMQMVCNSPYSFDEWIKNNWVRDVVKMTKHRYLMPLDEEVRKSVLKLSKPYPKRVK